MATAAEVAGEAEESGLEAVVVVAAGSANSDAEPDWPFVMSGEICCRSRSTSSIVREDDCGSLFFRCIMAACNGY